MISIVGEDRCCILLGRCRQYYVGSVWRSAFQIRISKAYSVVALPKEGTLVAFVGPNLGCTQKDILQQQLPPISEKFKQDNVESVQEEVTASK
jgi:hypothetical protein